MKNLYYFQAKKDLVSFEKYENKMARTVLYTYVTNMTNCIHKVKRV